MEDRISFTISEEEKIQVHDAIAVIDGILAPKLATLTTEEIKTIAKMGDKTIAFVEKSLEYGNAYPEFTPSFVDLDEANIDYNAIHEIRQLLNPISKIAKEMEDSMILSGSEAYSAALSIYDLIKRAAKMGQPGAKEAAAELKVRFPRNKRN